MTPTAYQDYLNDRGGLAPSTIRLYDRIVRRAGPDPLRWLLDLPLDRLPSRTVATYRSAVFHWLDWNDRPYDRSKLLRQVRGRSKQRAYRHALTDAQVKVYRESIESSAIGEPYATILLLLPWTGLRITEACRLKTDAIAKQGDHRGLDVVGKGNKRRFVPLPKAAIAVLRSWFDERRAKHVVSPWLFPSPRNALVPCAADTVRKHLRALDLPFAVTPHALRHTYASALLNMHVDLRVLQDLLGHASIATTAIYAAPTVDRLAEAVGRLDKDRGLDRDRESK